MHLKSKYFLWGCLHCVPVWQYPNFYFSIVAAFMFPDQGCSFYCDFFFSFFALLVFIPIIIVYAMKPVAHLLEYIFLMFLRHSQWCGSVSQRTPIRETFCCCFTVSSEHRQRGLIDMIDHKDVIKLADSQPHSKQATFWCLCVPCDQHKLTVPAQ